MPTSLGPIVDRFGPICVRSVDEESVRNTSEALEEFTDVAVPSDFPGTIPPDEIWLSSRVPKGERWIFVSEALARLRFESRGMDPTAAYYRALRHSAALRSNLARSNGYSSSHLDTAIRVRSLGTTRSGIKVWLVDGELIRDTLLTDWVEGGNSKANEGFIPEGEVWVDQEVPPKERKFIVLHEVTELGLMRGGVPYDKAHARAAKVEWAARQQRLHE